MAHFKQACVFLCAFCCSLFTSCGAAAPGSFSQNPEAPASSGPAAAGSATSQMEIAQQVKQLSETLEALVTLRDETYGGTFSYNMHVGLEYEGAYYEVSGADIPFLHHGDEGVVIHFMDLAFGQPGHEQEIEQHEQQKHQAIIIDEWSFGLLYFIHRYGPSRKELCYPNPSVQRPVTGKSTTWLSL